MHAVEGLRSGVIALRGALVAALLAVGGCAGVNLGDNPGPDVAKESGPLTIPPAHLQNGASE